MERLAPRARTPTFARAASGAPVVELPGSPWWAAGQTIPRRVPAGGEAREAFLDVPVLVLADRAVDSATLGAVLSAIPGATVAVDQDGTVAALPLVFGTRGAARSDVPPVHVRVELVSGGVVVDDGSGASPRAVSDADSAGAGWVDALHAGAERAMPRRWPRDVARVQVEVHAGVPAALLVAALEAIASRGRWVLELQAHVPPTGLPTVAIGEATVVGARSKAEVALSVAALAPGLLGCYEATLAVTSGYEGDATLGFFIAPLGDVRATELRLAPPALAECLGGVVAERSYPATPKEGGGTLVQLPVSFRIDRPGVATAGSPRR